MKILHLYAGIGGCRKLWNNVDVTAVEINPDIAEIYKDFFPNDRVIITDAHSYLLEHFNQFDFIWSSPPCNSHSQIRYIKNNELEPIYPDMKLYEEIFLLKYFFKGKWVVENVVPYYEPLVKPTVQLDRHYFWSNFMISSKPFKHLGDVKFMHYRQLQLIKEVNIDGYKLSCDLKDKILRSYVYPEIGKHILDCAFKIVQKKIH